MSARHMALAKAFPEYFTYEPHEADAVSGSGGPSGGPGARKGVGGVRWGVPPGIARPRCDWDVGRPGWL